MVPKHSPIRLTRLLRSWSTVPALLAATICFFVGLTVHPSLKRSAETVHMYTLLTGPSGWGSTWCRHSRSLLIRSYDCPREECARARRRRAAAEWAAGLARAGKGSNRPEEMSSAGEFAAGAAFVIIFFFIPPELLPFEAAAASGLASVMSDPCRRSNSAMDLDVTSPSARGVWSGPCPIITLAPSPWMLLLARMSPRVVSPSLPAGTATRDTEPSRWRILRILAAAGWDAPPVGVAVAGEAWTKSKTTSARKRERVDGDAVHISLLLGPVIIHLLEVLFALRRRVWW
mmetsp:Transcript_2199/g.4940  ORF Transcript_2199/g.4940 Transcript_2199/m.4940 type:complete len:288 (-) Transcript_2199:169-1032(-)